MSPYITPVFKRSKKKNRLGKLAGKWPLTYREIYKRYRNHLTKISKTQNMNITKLNLKDDVYFLKEI